MGKATPWRQIDEKCLCGAPMIARQVTTDTAQAAGARVDIEKRCSDPHCRFN